MKTAKQITVCLPLPDAPGYMARVCDALRGAQINIEAIDCTVTPDVNEIHIIVDEPEKAEMTLESIGKIREDELLVFERPNKQGQIFELARKCAGADIGIKNILATTHGPGIRTLVYLQVDNLEKAKEVLKDS